MPPPVVAATAAAAAPVFDAQCNISLCVNKYIYKFSLENSLYFLMLENESIKRGQDL